MTPSTFLSTAATALALAVLPFAASASRLGDLVAAPLPGTPVEPGALIAQGT